MELKEKMLSFQKSYRAYYTTGVINFVAYSNEHAIATAKAQECILIDERLQSVHAIDENNNISKIYDICINDLVDMKYQQDINNMIVSMPRIQDLSSIDKVNYQLMQIQSRLKEWQESLRSRDVKY